MSMFSSDIVAAGVSNGANGVVAGSMKTSAGKSCGMSACNRSAEVLDTAEDVTTATSDEGSLLNSKRSAINSNVSTAMNTRDNGAPGYK